jgi:ParB family chromosome partitioning protein
MTAHEIAARQLSVREAEKLVARYERGAGRGRRAARHRNSRDVARLEERLAMRSPPRVEIRIRGRRGERESLGDCLRLARRAERVARTAGRYET